jgi:hypothetical protein
MFGKEIKLRKLRVFNNNNNTNNNNKGSFQSTVGYRRGL